ncbi:MAG TPA: NrfD/PsrC family molybdoenzyme membrane anchor subunit [Ilumatobacteraceae bacterium]|jgi:formate-dependent nitrite reductase membrane component NrfD
MATATTTPSPAVGYYGKPIVAAHVWKDYIGWYFFTGGLAGASSTIAAVAELAARPTLARHARRAALVGLLPSPALLIADLGRPKRFANMLRVIKPTSPMSIGSWLLAAYSPFAVGGVAADLLGIAPRARRAATIAAGLLGPGIATYTGVLVADTATPVWHEAGRELPGLFAASAAASAGAMTTLLSSISGPPERAAVRIAAGGALAEVVMSVLMRKHLGDLDTYRSDPHAHALDRASRTLSIAGAIIAMAGRRRRPAAILGATAIAAGSVCERLAVLRAGTASANDPRSVLGAAS